MSRNYVVRSDPELEATAAKRYGDLEIEGDAVARVPQTFQMAKRVLETDGFAATTITLLKGDQIVDMQMPIFSDQAGKMLTMRTVATRVRMLKADGFVLLGEVWLAPTPSPERFRSGDYPRAREHPGRMEALQVLAVTQDGRFGSALAVFTRTDDGIEVGEPMLDEIAGSAMMLRPILQAWGIADPDPIGVAAAMVDSQDDEPA